MILFVATVLIVDAVIRPGTQWAESLCAGALLGSEIVRILLSRRSR